MPYKLPVFVVAESQNTVRGADKHICQRNLFTDMAAENTVCFFLLELQKSLKQIRLLAMFEKTIEFSNKSEISNVVFGSGRSF